MLKRILSDKSKFVTLNVGYDKNGDAKVDIDETNAKKLDILLEEKCKIYQE